MAKLADAPDLGSGAARHVGSTPIIRTPPAPKGEGLTLINDPVFVKKISVLTYII
jgi:hypothetical protein